MLDFCAMLIRAIGCPARWLALFKLIFNPILGTTNPEVSIFAFQPLLSTQLLHVLVRQGRDAQDA
jgi:hypothetical protein